MHLKTELKFKTTLFFLYSFLTFFYTPLLAHASKAYITDEFRISLRRGPTIENKILRFLPSGSPVEIIQTMDEGWTEVMTLSPDEKQITGWVLSRYLIHRLPYANQTTILGEENQKLKSELLKYGEVDQKNISLINKLTNDLNETKKELEKANKEFLMLKKNSANYFNLEKEFEKLKKEHDENLVIKNRLQSTRNHQWMAIGAGILIIGYIVGFSGGKREKKTKRRGYL